MTSTYGAVKTDFIMDDVNCDGSEGHLFDCDYLPTHNCGAHEGAGVVCYETIELRGGSVINEGNIYLNGQPICDDYWENNDATVACRMLG